jgi:hypothetical protein
MRNNLQNKHFFTGYPFESFCVLTNKLIKCHYGSAGARYFKIDNYNINIIKRGFCFQAFVVSTGEDNVIIPSFKMIKNLIIVLIFSVL